MKIGTNCKNDLYKKFFNQFYEKVPFVLNEKFNISLNNIEENLNKTLEEFYQEKEVFNKEEHIQIHQPVKESLDSKADKNVQIFLEEEFEKLQKIQSELHRVLKENFKISLEDNLSLSRKNSEAVLILKEELFDMNKKSPVIDIEEASDYDILMRREMIDSTVTNILALIKKISEKTKAPDNSCKKILFYF